MRELLKKLAPQLGAALVGSLAAIGGARLLPLDTVPVAPGERVAVVVEGPSEVQVFRGRVEVEGGRFALQALPPAQTAPVRS